MPDFRTHHPDNTCVKVCQNYREYKDPWLIRDFKNRCGYCNDHDVWASGRRGMQIDHFAPKKKFPLQKNIYTNLVYSCFYCNNHKSDDWVTDAYDRPVCINSITGYIHPRDINYAVAFQRTGSGKITPISDVAKYMFTKLCLGLKRHELIFILEELNELWNQLNHLIIDDTIDEEKRKILRDRKRSVSDKFMEYFQQYRRTLA